MVFDMWDREGKGYITVEDLGSAMRLMGRNPSKLHLSQLIDLVDSDADHNLDFEDFLRMMVLCDLKDDDDADNGGGDDDDANGGASDDLAGSEGHDQSDCAYGD